MHTLAIDIPDRATTPAQIELSTSVELEDLYRREYPNLLAVATALSGADGEDLVHDTIVRAILNWRRVRRLERPGGWCHRVLVNRCRSWWRRRQTESSFRSRQRSTEEPVPQLTAEMVAFWDAVRRLPERPRHVVTLYYAGDHPVAQVAAILDIPEGTVRSDLARARQALALELER